MLIACLGFRISKALLPVKSLIFSSIFSRNARKRHALEKIFHWQWESSWMRLVLVPTYEYRLSLMKLVERYALTIFVECCLICLKNFRLTMLLSWVYSAYCFVLLSQERLISMWLILFRIQGSGVNIYVENLLMMSALCCLIDKLKLIFSGKWITSSSVMLKPTMRSRPMYRFYDLTCVDTSLQHTLAV